MEDDEELEEIKRRKMAELQQQAAVQEQQEEAREEYEAQRQAALRQILTAAARERLARLRIARPDFAEAVENQLIMLAQSGRLGGVVDDSALVQILEKLTPEKREITIKRI
jgi:programmed cell death protein 5